jgi:hypothetical protein
MCVLWSVRQSFVRNGMRIQVALHMKNSAGRDSLVEMLVAQICALPQTESDLHRSFLLQKLSLGDALVQRAIGWRCSHEVGVRVTY